MTILPPVVIDVRVREREKRGFRLWLPLFLLWPILLIVVGFALVVSLAIDVALWVAGARYHHYTLLLLKCLNVLAQVRGTRAHIRSADSTLVDVNIY
jgi:hypothetical protein